MPEFKRCPHCVGRKKVMALGMIEKECPTCVGVGHIKHEPSKVSVVDAEELTISEIPIIEAAAPEPKAKPKAKPPVKPKPKPKNALAVRKLGVKEACQDQMA